ncbi:hypothetical protein [Lentiprolixibacter aurantiacus]|uniref:Uncharacterized protein n=1 Tax=Lentiprolixibacter aurantiacus TaxID=2993939 RepID=A0AAE3MJS3_9FLAO|nr:hypothetical protein [Lentiprolixibacter aurantiacus]MCX2718916.1 hypothetical protein [Lentiprolixibacter aurantiacus]
MRNIKNNEMKTVEQFLLEPETVVTESIERNKHLQNILYGVWKEEDEEETFLNY